MFKRKAFFLKGAIGQLFCLHYQPNREATSHVLVFPPFAEELNRSRGIIASTAALFAKNGFSVLVVDLYGTGDSEGNFENISWDIWKKDMLRGINFLQQHQDIPINFLAIRLGTLLALDILLDHQKNSNLFEVPKFIAWQPIFNTQNYIKQFLRIQLAASMQTATPIKTTEIIKQKIQDNGFMEIAGYPLSAKLMEDILSLCISNGTNYNLKQINKLVFVQITMGSTNKFSEEIQNFILDTPDIREKLNIQLIKGTPFWQTSELQGLPELGVLSLDNLVNV